ncbi:hypothetical protein LPJ66_008459 [Kickxella alabastrina]|uniref:Uncharacterized protein n=1 Tax=Kickxella alabastrina TaxID=61397 RepID=A0ACC1I9N0_9FUNG|nr:hypothetical protein LPJ66_008459 [Kickxella alabastrina]
MTDDIKATQPEQTVKNKNGKRGKVFSTQSSMMDILNQVSQVEEGRLNRKMDRQKTLEKFAYDKEKRLKAKKVKNTSRLEEIKNQLRQGHTLAELQGKPVKKTKPKKKVDRSLDKINREWSASVEGSPDSTPDQHQKKSVSFAL